MHKKAHLTLFFIFAAALFFSSCREKEVEAKGNVRIAFMSDVHLQDIYGTFSDTDFKGIKTQLQENTIPYGP